jgi:hypothetical protein
VNDDYGRRTSGDDEETRDPWPPADAGRPRDDLWEPEARDRATDGWGERNDRPERAADAWDTDADAERWTGEGGRWDRDTDDDRDRRAYENRRADEDRERRAWTDDDDEDRATSAWRGDRGADADELERERLDRDRDYRADRDRDFGDDRDRDYGADGDRDDGDDWDSRSERAAVLDEVPASAETREEDALRSFVESEELPSPERMAAAELEAEREAARDAAEAAVSEPELAESRRGRFGARSVDGRLARLHLKGGLIPLARAELETMAGQVTLDLEALADLAEARWRSGDLLGAGEAAQAHLSRGGDEVTALVVAVEALTAQGRTIDARRLAAQVLERTGGELDGIFGGQPRAHLWSRPADLRALDGETEEEPDGAREPLESVAPAGAGAEDAPRTSDDAIGLGAPEEQEETIWTETRAAGPPLRADEAAEFGVLSTAPGGHAQPEESPAEETSAWPAADLGRDTSETEWPEMDRARDEGVARAAADSGEVHDAEAEDTFEPGAYTAETYATEAAGEPSGEGRPEDATLVTAAPEGPTEPGTDTTDEAPAVAAGPVTAGRRMLGLAARRELRAIEEAIDEGRLESVAGRLALLLRTDPDAAARIVDVALDAVGLLGPGTAEAANLEIVRGDALRVLGRSEEAEAAYEASRRALEPRAPPESGEADGALDDGVDRGESLEGGETFDAGTTAAATDEQTPAAAESEMAPLATDESSYAGELVTAAAEAPDEPLGPTEPATGEEALPVGYDETSAEDPWGRTAEPSVEAGVDELPPQDAEPDTSQPPAEEAVLEGEETTLEAHETPVEGGADGAGESGRSDDGERRGGE